MATSGEDLRSIRALIKKHYPGPGELQGFTEVKTGHINRTYVSTWDLYPQIRFVHQVINSQIFLDVPGLMQNIKIVTQHLKQRIDADTGEQVLEIVSAIDGSDYIVEQGNYWRTYRYIEDTEVFERSPTSDYAGEAGAALGKFQKRLATCDTSKLIDTIPQFLHTPLRYSAFYDAIKKDPARRVKKITSDIASATNFESQANSLIAGLENGSLPKRVTHNDMKLNNILFKTGAPRALALVDLDTCMPGTALFDFGDLVRSVGVVSAEDEVDLQRVQIDTELLKAVTQGYLKECGDMLVEGEKKLLALAPKVLAITLGVRFLTDYINGDTYFRIHRPEHNLERARAQFEVAKKLGECESIISSVLF